MLAKVFLDLFGSLTTNTMDDLLDSTDIRHYKSGQLLFEEGDEADGLYIVVSGRLHVETTGSDNTQVPVAEVRPPHSVGELALMSDSKRSASVYATRESTIAFLEKQRFHELIGQRPNMMLSLAQLIVRRNAENARRSQWHTEDQNFVFIPLDTRLPLRRFLQQLKRQMRLDGKPVLLDSHGFDTLYGKKGAAQTGFSDVFTSAIAEWLDDKENRYSEVIYLTDATWTAWTKRCVNRADRIILLANASQENSAELREIEHQLARIYAKARVKPPIDLVLLHPSHTELPRGTLNWLEPRTLSAFHHVRMDDKDHIARLTRRLCGKALGIVFSGGGARGYAHLGVQKVIEEYAINIDYIGGSSMGGLLGATMAMGQNVARTYEYAKIFGNKRALYDYTLPLTSLMKSAKLTNFCLEVYGDTLIEDLWVPYFCVSSNLADGREVVHDRGELWLAVRSTISLPGIFSPVPTEDGQLLTDGAVLNTFPVDVMHRMLGGNGNIIGVNVSQIPEQCEYYNYGTLLSGWQVLFSRLNPFARRIKTPRIAETLLRSNDIKSILRLNETRAMLKILVEPDVSEVQLLDFKSFQSISEIGYSEAIQVFSDHALISTTVTVGNESATHRANSNLLDNSTDEDQTMPIAPVSPTTSPQA